MRLVVCVDRDDDLGRKTGVLGPVVGRTAVLEAAQKLAIADPEDSDTNAMYGAVRLLDQLREQGEEADVVVLTGSPKVGVLSDRKVGEQFDRVLAQFPVEAAHLISDGAEDEYLLPVLQSRVHKIDGVHRIYVRQSASLESTYYTVLKALKDQKLRNKTILPAALVCLVIGIALATGVFFWGVTALLILLGIYLIFWVFDIDEAIIDSVRSASTDIRTGSVTFGVGLVAITLAGLGFLFGDAAYNHFPNESVLQRALAFPQAGLAWWVATGLVWETGRALRVYIARARIPRSYPSAMISIGGIGAVAYALFQLVDYFESFPAIALPLTLVFLVGGLAAFIGASALYQYVKRSSSAAAAPS